MLGPGSIAVIGLAALVMFGPKKLPELGKAAGKRFASSRMLQKA